MMNCLRFGTIAWFLLFCVPAVWAQDTVQVSGSVTDNNGQAISQTVQVRAWSWADDEVINGERYTGYVVRDGHSAYVNTSGQYVLQLPPDTYKLDARVGVTTRVAPCSTIVNNDSRPRCRYPDWDGTSSTNRWWLEERWHEAGSGDENWVQDDGTLLTITDGQDAVTELNFRMGLAGAASGRVRRSNGSYMSGALVRIEQTNDHRRHHNSRSLPNPSGATNRIGFFYSRGHRPSLVHRLLIHDRDGRHETYLHDSTHTPVAGEYRNYNVVTLSAMDTDPYALNRSEATARDIGRWNFDSNPPPVWSTTDDASNVARIAPRNNDVVNWFCWNVEPEDRFIVTATTLNTIPGLSGRYHPWMDPILRVSNRDTPDNPAPGTSIDRYSGPGPLDAEVDTGRISVSGEYCAAVSAAGDFDFDGTDQYIAGPYVLEIAMGNRPPALTVYHGATVNPSSVAIGEGDTVQLDLDYEDPEGDPIARSFTFRQGGADVAGSTFNDGPNSATWTWQAPLNGAGSYVVSFRVGDGEFDTSHSVTINVGSVNYPPTAPTLSDPANEDTVETRQPTLIADNGSDPDGDDGLLRYDVEVYTEDPEDAGAAPAYTFRPGHSPSGFFTVTLAEDLPEKAWVWWRARADDSQDENRYSEWTPFWRFFVHAEPPEVEAYQEDVLVTEPVEVDEGSSLLLDLAYRAPFGDIPSISFVMHDVHGNEIDTADLEEVDSGIEGEGAAIFTWDAGPLDSENSPYEIEFTVFDGRYTTSTTVDLDVLSYNLEPTAPVIVQPADGDDVASRYPEIIAENATDPEQEDLFLHFEVAFDEEFNDIVAQSDSGGVPQDSGSTTGWDVTPALLWSNTYYVRAFATDASGLAGPYSNTNSFFVLPRTAPTIVEPEDEAEIPTRWPTIVAENAVDPAGDALFLHFEIALDDAFTDIVEQSPVDGVLQDESGTTEWRVENPLLWSNTYYVRAFTTDEDGLEGPTSGTTSFVIEPRTAPVIVEPEEGQTVSSREPTIVAENAYDPDEIPLSLHFEIASDPGFTDVVAETNMPGVDQDESGQTQWQVDPRLTFGETYFARATSYDENDLAGPTSESVQFSVRDNGAPSSSTLGGPFASECTGGAITESPLVVPITHGSDPDGDPVQLHIQVYRHGGDPDDEVEIDMTVPAETSGDVTEVEIDIGSLSDNTRYTIRVRSYDGIDYSSWHTCDFWSNTRNTPPTGIVIITPEPETELPLNTTEVTVEVQNAYDPDTVVPGTSIEIIWCSSLDDEFGDCPESLSEWNSVPQSSLDPEDTTEFVVDGITNRELWHIKACAMDETGVCGSSDTTSVIADGEDGGGGTGEAEGCCTTSRGGDPWLSFLAVFALALLAPRRRRGLA